MLVLAWIILVVLAYRVSLIEIEHKEYDPFAVLDIDRVGLGISMESCDGREYCYLGSIDFGNQTCLSRFE